MARISARGSVYLVVELEYHRNVFKYIGHIAGDTQFVAIEGLGSCTGRIKLPQTDATVVILLALSNSLSAKSRFKDLSATHPAG